MNKTLCLFASLFTSALHCFCASGPNSNHIPEDANWVAHLDFQSILNSKIGSALMVEAQKDPKFTQKLNGIKAVFGLDLEKLGTATAYGTGKRDEGVVITKGGINSMQIEGFAGLNDNVSLQKKAGKTLYSFKKGAFCSLGPDSIIASTSKKLLVPGLEVISGKNPGQKNNPLLVHLCAGVENPMALITIRLPEVLANMRNGESISAPEAAIMKKANLMGFALSEEGSDMQMVIAMQAENEETAKHLENVMQGASSLLALSAGIDIDPNLNEMLPFMKTAISRDMRMVGLQLTIDSAFLLKKIRQEMEKKEGSHIENKVE
jgi:hypothetical protein